MVGRQAPTRSVGRRAPPQEFARKMVALAALDPPYTLPPDVWGGWSNIPKGLHTIAWGRRVAATPGRRVASCRHPEGVAVGPAETPSGFSIAGFRVPGVAGNTKDRKKEG
jgi:hypothetical protein